MPHQRACVFTCCITRQGWRNHYFKTPDKNLTSATVRTDFWTEANLLTLINRFLSDEKKSLLITDYVKMAGGRSANDDGFYSNLRYNIVPPLFLVFFTYVTQVLIVIGNPDLNFGLGTLVSFFTGLFSSFAWKVVLVFYLWCYLSLILPGTKVFKGPPTPQAGYVPEYAANGTQFYLVSLAAFLVLSYLHPDVCVGIYQEMPAIAAVLNATALGLCCYLVIKGRTNPEDVRDNAEAGEFPLPYLFYRGIELHPRLLGVDIKQWTNCRVGMMGWSLLVVAFCVAGIQIHGFSQSSMGQLVNAVLINIYLLKFFYWETGYFNTLDITLDRAGYYLCWGCLCWVQVCIWFNFTPFKLLGNVWYWISFISKNIWVAIVLLLRTLYTFLTSDIWT